MADKRLNRMVHVLTHLGLSAELVSSTTIAAMLDTNSAVVRRTMAPLRKRGIVSSEEGRAGGWRLLKTLEDLSVLDVYDALYSDNIPEFDDTAEITRCPIENASNEKIREAVGSAADYLRKSFHDIKLADIAELANRQMINSTLSDGSVT